MASPPSSDRTQPVSQPQNGPSLSVKPADVLVPLALMGTLLLVYGADLVLFRGDKEAPPGTPELVVEEVEHVETQTVSEPRRLRLAVTPPVFDDMGTLLKQLGEGYQFDTIELDDLLNDGLLSEYDVVFFTCGPYPESWLGAVVGQGERNATVYQWNERVEAQLKKSLRKFVQAGGTLYASDWRFSAMQSAFPEFVDVRRAADEGTAQEVTARVVDSGLQEIIGSEIQLHFDLGGWHPAAFAGEDVQTYLEGSYQKTVGGSDTAPLLVKMRHGEGTILYTAFHNEKQTSETELELLKYLVFTMVTSKAESKVTETMVKGGFSPQKQSLLSTSSGAPSVTRSYQCKTAGRLQFALAFEDQGAVLHVKVVAPDRKVYEQEGRSTFTIDIPNASPGEWTYTVTAREVPFENFPFTLSVWQK